MQSISLPYRYSHSYKGDTGLIVLSAILLVFGLVMMTSASIEIASSQYDDAFYHFKRQLVFMCMGLVAATVVVLTPLKFWYRSSVVLLLLAYLLLILVLLPGIGHEVNGSRRWFRFGIMSLQASELAKLFMLVFMAWFLSRYHDLVRNSVKGFLYPVAFMAPMSLLLLLEPDFGAVVVLSIAVFGMLFLAGVKLWQFAGTGLLLGAVAVVLIRGSEYRMARVDSFLQALKDPFSEEVVYGSGYQLAQALIGFGRGEWFGVGLGNSIQKMYFLPEAHTDFVLAIIAEELGMLVVLVLLGMFLAFTARAMIIARRNEIEGRLFAAYLGYGIAFLFMAQVFINAAVNVGLLPTKGLTLPFMSYGGSSLIMWLVMLALLLRMDLEHHHLRLPRAGAVQP